MTKKEKVLNAVRRLIGYYNDKTDDLIGCPLCDITNDHDCYGCPNILSDDNIKIGCRFNKSGTKGYFRIKYHGDAKYRSLYWNKALPILEKLNEELFHNKQKYLFEELKQCDIDAWNETNN